MILKFWISGATRNPKYSRSTRAPSNERMRIVGTLGQPEHLQIMMRVQVEHDVTHMIIVALSLCIGMCLVCMFGKAFH